MQKIVLKAELHNDKIKQKAMKVVSGIQGVESVSVDMNENKMTVVGSIDPVTVVRKLRRLSHTDIVSVGPAKEEEKEKEKDEKKPDEASWPFCYPYYPYYPCYPAVMPVREDPIGCVIC
ncbi:heavy metal-associated isoprenylated plant protein 39-like [Prosopis cineraria]|uniref:heavy metal-associated isoprenylated plant protein 39-like n=1 Tax=Prosopis cineraria TaxID=364024 RepID=UPI00240F33B0|nr:heavy metal-associated isoprenylated plant protein 39-like [Prosopis cineraria]